MRFLRCSRKTSLKINVEAQARELTKVTQRKIGSKKEESSAEETVRSLGCGPFKCMFDCTIRARGKDKLRVLQGQILKRVLGWGLTLCIILFFYVHCKNPRKAFEHIFKKVSGTIYFIFWKMCDTPCESHV